MAVFTPKQNITACEIMANAKHIVLALEGFNELVTLKLVGPDVEEDKTEEIYGSTENDGKIFELNESDVC